MGKVFSFCVWYHSPLVSLARIKTRNRTQTKPQKFCGQDVHILTVVLTETCAQPLTTY